ncbi:MAG: GNAT family N-acetyltransferase [Lentisphaerae bacterium]|nr:GNAT family N-acetyltransferase [Lentisphaerota bacterium]
MNNAVVRVTAKEDRDAIVGLLAACPMFRPCEVAIGVEVLDEAVKSGPEGHYQSRTAFVEDAVVGWICWGPTPCTEATYDIYWIVVAEPHRGHRIGGSMLSAAEQEIRERGGRLAVVETSARSDYAATRKFYARHAYQQAAVVPDFYAPGDNKEIYVKPLQGLIPVCAIASAPSLQPEVHADDREKKA